VDLVTLLTERRAELSQRLHLGRAHWDELVTRIGEIEADPTKHCDDEQLWTCLLACAYASIDRGPSLLAQALAEGPVSSRCIWFEVLPVSPRENEGQTNLDLALGDISLRRPTRSGIELSQTPDPTIVFCEFKWFSDIAGKVSFDEHRNQLARVIENALMFRSRDGDFAKVAYVALVTPAVFKERRAPSRLYWYKWHEYARDDSTALLTDLEDCCLSPSAGLPSVRDRLSSLRLTWRTYEDLVFGAPDSPVRDAVRQFYEKHAGSLLRSWSVK
jgi:hypothetical protein